MYLVIDDLPSSPWHVPCDTYMGERARGQPRLVSPVTHGLGSSKEILMSTGYTSTDIITGAEVFGADGEKVGTVAAVYPGYIVVEKGFFFPTDYYIPMSAVASADNDQVYLNVAKDVALQQGWDAQPVDLETASYDTTTITDTTNVGTGYAASDVGAGYGMGTGQVAGYEATAEDEIRIPVME